MSNSAPSQQPLPLGLQHSTAKLRHAAKWRGASLARLGQKMPSLPLNEYISAAPTASHPLPYTSPTNQSGHSSRGKIPPFNYIKSRPCTQCKTAGFLPKAKVLKPPRSREGRGEGGGRSWRSNICWAPSTCQAQDIRMKKTKCDALSSRSDAR